MIARLPGWVARIGIGVEDLSWQVLRDHRGSCGLSGPRKTVPRPFLQMVSFLAPSCAPAENALAGEGLPASAAVLIKSFAAYLRMERSFARSTASGHLSYARIFVVRASIGIGLLGRYQFKEALISFLPHHAATNTAAEVQAALTTLICEGPL